MEFVNEIKCHMKVALSLYLLKVSKKQNKNKYAIGNHKIDYQLSPTKILHILK